MAIKTIIFDLGGVIVLFDFGNAYSRMEALSGLVREEIRARLTGDDFMRRFEAGYLSPAGFLDELNRRLGTHLGHDEFRDLWVSIFARQTLIPEDLIASLRSRYRVLLLSNTNQTHFEWIADNYPHLGHFHHWVLSYKVKAMKPEPAIYAEAIRQAQCAPGECFFTDDVAAYVEGARAAGIDAEQFTGLETLRGHLAARGIDGSRPV